MNTARGLQARTKREGSSRYELSGTIATGGMAVILRGVDRWAQREVAHKRLRVDGENNRSRMTALFQREYDTLARLKHPNIVEVYDYGFDEHGPYYAMELLSGDDLSKVGPLPYREACRILRDVASALALVHARRFVHRDVSPNNVRLTSVGVAKLIDFGALTPFGRPEEIAGTAAFIAPECLDAVALDQRADLYSLGALAYWTLTRRTPYAAQALAELQQAWSVPLLPPSAHVSTVPAALDELVISLLSHDRAARPSNAGEVIERLTNIGELAAEAGERKVAYSYLKHPPLVGREHALSQLRGALEGALAGNGQVVVVEAALGLGKSALLDQFAVDAQLRGATVLRAEGGAQEGKHGIARSLIQFGTRVFPERDATEPFVQEVTGVQPMPERVSHPVEALERSARSAARLRDMLLRLSARGPLVLLLDDADRADEESLGLLASMGSDLSEHSILLVMSRPPVSGGTGSHAYQQLAARAQRVSLQSLEEAQVVELIGSMFGDVPNSSRVALWLHGQTGGNPAQCIDMLRLLLQRKAIRYARGTFTLPHDIDAVAGRERRIDGLLTRLAGLSRESELVFQLVCLHHGPLDQLQLASASALSARAVLLAVEQLVQRELAVQRGAEVTLRGESMRGALERTLDEAHKHALHRALARVLSQHVERTLQSELSRARHLFAAGDEAQLEAAELMASLLKVHGHAVSISALAVPLLASALAVFRAHGASELHCASLLGALSAGGFYGNLEARQYLRPALEALSQQCGFTLAARLRPRLGPVLSLWIGLVYGFVLGFFLPSKLGRTGIKQRVEDFLLVASTGIAAASATSDTEAATLVQRHLAPVSGFPRWFAPSYCVDFCIATAELALGQSVNAAARYGRLLEVLTRPVFALHERLRTQLLLGCLNGKAHAVIDQPGSESLTLADELERRSAFFAPLAETVRVSYFALRGQHATAERHRARAELLALRGGASWTSAAILARRSLEYAYVTDDAVTLVRAVAEIERLSRVAPSLLPFRQLALAQLSLIRGRPREAEATLSAVLSEDGDALAVHRQLHACYAHALNQLEQFAKARSTCTKVMDTLSAVQRAHSSSLRTPVLQWAHAEAALGNYSQAEALLDEQREHALARGNQLELGLIEAERARLAIRRRDVSSFDAHYAAMSEHFKATGHPALVRQCEAMLSSAIGVGMKPQVNLSAWLRGVQDELDGATVLEARPIGERESQPG